VTAKIKAHKVPTIAQVAEFIELMSNNTCSGERLTIIVVVEGFT